MNRWVLTILLFCSTFGCNNPSVDELRDSETSSKEPVQEIQTITLRESDPLKVSKLTAVPITSDENDTSGGIKSKLSFKEKIVAVNRRDLLKSVALVKRVAPTHWDDLEQISTEYLIQFSPITAKDHVETSLIPGTDLNFESRWWAVFDFNGDNVADWIGLQISKQEQSTIDLVCVCTDAGLNESVVLHGIIQTSVDMEQAAFFLGRESVLGHMQRRQQFGVYADEIDALLESFSQIIFWNGKHPQSVSKSELNDQGQDTKINLSCEKCVYYYIDYSWILADQAQSETN